MTEVFPALHIIGLMSGTSMDGIDACLAKIQFKKNGDSDIALASAEIIETHSSEYSLELSKKLLALVNHPENTHLQTVCELNFEIADAFADCALALIQKLPVNFTVDAIASHGQTVFHIPPKSPLPLPPSRKGRGNNYLVPSTLQLGNTSVIAQKTGIKTIGDFRSADMAHGGHGAPLVPFADQLLFQHDSIHRAVHNLGGISNTTILPSLNSQKSLFAFDTGPANCLINLLCETYYQKSYDASGEIAKTGTINNSLLEALLSLEYFQQLPPKSTGRELFGQALLEKYFLSGPYQDILPHDKIATATALTVKSIQQAYQQIVMPKVAVSEVILGGGGTLNNYLMAGLKSALEPLGITCKTHADFNIPNQYKEALAFALLGYANLVGVPGNIPACTGASQRVILGHVSAV